jgi:hypothetical protein
MFRSISRVPARSRRRHGMWSEPGRVTADVIHVVEHPELQDLAEQREMLIIQQVADREVQDGRTQPKISLTIPSDGGLAVRRLSRNQGQPSRRMVRVSGAAYAECGPFGTAPGWQCGRRV